MKFKLFFTVLFLLVSLCPFSRNAGFSDNQHQGVWFSDYDSDELSSSYHAYIETEGFVIYKSGSYNSSRTLLIDGVKTIMKINGRFELMAPEDENVSGNKKTMTYKNRRFRAVFSGKKSGSKLVGTMTVTDLSSYESYSLPAVSDWNSNVFDGM